MAVVTAHPVKAERVAKGRLSHSRRRNEPHFAPKMSSQVPLQPPETGQPMPLTTSAPEANSSESLVGTDREALKRRKASKSKPLSDLRRSASTPHLGKATHGDANVLSPTSDKKRNKLGYHRTSIACSHCRRRKIRCQIPAPEDPNGRCSNCIRLKKDCTFYPVDVAVAMEGARIVQTHAQSEIIPPEATLSGPVSSSSHSSPFVSSTSHPSSVLEIAGGQIQSPRGPMGAQQQRELGSFDMSAVSEGPFQPPYQFTSPPNTGWAGQPPSASHFQHQQRPTQGEAQYWAMNSGPPSTQHAAPNLPAFDSSGQSFTSPNFAYNTGSPPPAAPGRSMSLGTIDGMAHQPGYQNAHFGQPGYPANYPINASHHYAQNTLAHEAHGGIHPPESVPRAWSATPQSNPQPISGAQPMAVPHSPFYPQQQGYGSFEHRDETSFMQQAQYYDHAQHPS